MNASTFNYTVYIRSSPQELWTALLDSGVQRQIWLGHYMESQWEEGDSWRMLAADGRTANSGEVVKIEPSQKLVLTWRNELYPERKVEGYSRVELELHASDTSTKLTVKHSLNRPDSKLIAVASESWPLILSNLKSYMEQGRSSTTRVGCPLGPIDNTNTKLHPSEH